MNSEKSVFRSRCPRCGGKIIVSELCQYSLDYTIKSDGKISKNYKRYDSGSIECNVAACENVGTQTCDVLWENGEFCITDDQFEDFKYTEEHDEARERDGV